MCACTCRPSCSAAECLSPTASTIKFSGFGWALNLRWNGGPSRWDEERLKSVESLIKDRRARSIYVTSTDYAIENHVENRKQFIYGDQRHRQNSNYK